jgi:hypothetical protein
VLGAAAVGLGCAGEGRRERPERPQVPVLAPADTHIGTTHPLTVIGSDPQGEWVAICQAREDTNGDGRYEVHFGHHGESSGDVLRPYLVIGTGAGEPVSAYLGRDPTGRFVIVGQDGRLWLRDLRLNTRVDLTSRDLDTEPDPSGLFSGRVARFDPGGSRLAMILRRDRFAEIALLDLETEQTTRVLLGPGRVWRTGFSGDGRWLLSQVIRNRDRSKVLDLPDVSTTYRGTPCTRPSSFSIFGLSESPNEVHQVLTHVESGRSQRMEDFLMFFGDRFLRRDVTRRILLGDASGANVELVPASCDGPIVAASAEYQTVIVACGAHKVPSLAEDLPVPEARRLREAHYAKHVRLTAFRPGGTLPVRLAPEEEYHDTRDLADGRFALLRGPYNDDARRQKVFDFKDWRVRELSKPVCDLLVGDYVLAWNGADTRAVHVLSGETRFVSGNPCGHSMRRDPYLLIGTDLIHTPTVTRVGTLARGCESPVCEPFALTTDGRALVKVGTEPRASWRADHGPLVWLSPRWIERTIPP